jgi:transaldolase
VPVFAGHIADTGVDPVPLMAEAKRILRWRPHAQLLWASPRELLNIFQAEDAGATSSRWHLRSCAGWS